MVIPANIHLEVEPDKNKFAYLLSIALRRKSPRKGETLVKGREDERNNGNVRRRDDRKSPRGRVFPAVHRIIMQSAEWICIFSLCGPRSGWHMPMQPPINV